MWWVIVTVAMFLFSDALVFRTPIPEIDDMPEGDWSD